MKRFLLRIQTYLRKLAGVPVANEMPLPQSDIEKSLYEICKNNPNGIMPGVQPSGTIHITENGTYDVAQFAEAEVEVADGGYSAGDWLDVTKPVGIVTSDIDFKTGESGMSLLANRLGITEVHLPNTSCIPTSIFQGCSNLEKVLAPNAVFVDNSSFRFCSKLRTVVFPKVKYAYSYAFSRCTNLESADFGGTPGSGQGLWRGSIFDDDTKFGTLVLRSSAVWALTSTEVFSGTKFASGKAGGTLYVPGALISSYQTATNWATILGYPNNQIKSIESTATDPDAPVDLTTHYIDGTLITA